MATYDYHCPSNGRVIEVSHSIHDKLTTWGELCEAADVPLGKTAAGEPIERLISAPTVQTAPDWRRQEAAAKASKMVAETKAPEPTGYDAHGHGCYGGCHDH